MKAVYVKWVDSGRSDGWESPEDAIQRCTESDALICETIAWLVHEDDDWVLISSSKHDGEILSPLQIPRVAIKELRPGNVKEAFFGTGWQDSERSDP